MRVFFALLPIFILLFAAFSFADDALPNPEQWGPYPVGVTTTEFVDQSRIDPATNEPRALLTEIWYPAADEARGLPKNRLNDFVLRFSKADMIAPLCILMQADVMQVDKTFQNESVRDARIRDGVYPLVLFSHGNGGIRCQNAFWCEHVASHGYVVMAPDHTGNCAVTCVNGKVVGFNEKLREQAEKDRPLDMRFLIDCMFRMSNGGDSRFQGRVDMAHIGMAGHSFGGFTSTWVADTEPRVACIIPMAGCAKERTVYDRPVMVIQADEDLTLGKDRNACVGRYYEESKGPRYLVEFKNAGHYTFTEMNQFQPAFGDGVGNGKRLTNGEPIAYIPMSRAKPLINGYTTAFLGKFLKGRDGYDAYLSANHDEAELIYKFGH